MSQKTIDVNDQVLNKLAAERGETADATLQAEAAALGQQHATRFIQTAWDGLSQAQRITALAAVGVDPFAV